MLIAVIFLGSESKQKYSNSINNNYNNNKNNNFDLIQISINLHPFKNMNLRSNKNITGLKELNNNELKRMRLIER